MATISIARYAWFDLVSDVIKEIQRKQQFLVKKRIMAIIKTWETKKTSGNRRRLFEISRHGSDDQPS